MLDRSRSSFFSKERERRRETGMGRRSSTLALALKRRDLLTNQRPKIQNRRGASLLEEERRRPFHRDEHRASSAASARPRIEPELSPLSEGITMGVVSPYSLCRGEYSNAAPSYVIHEPKSTLDLRIVRPFFASFTRLPSLLCLASSR